VFSLFPKRSKWNDWGTLLVCSLPNTRRVETRRKVNGPAQVRQCLIFDKPPSPAKLIGVEYMITKRLYEGLDPEERKLWHSHDYEVSLSALLCSLFYLLLFKVLHTDA
jgi:hypothetical protein